MTGGKYYPSWDEDWEPPEEFGLIMAAEILRCSPWDEHLQDECWFNTAHAIYEARVELSRRRK